jgi:hypothetical protein
LSGSLGPPTAYEAMGISCTAQSLTSGSLKKKNEFPRSAGPVDPDILLNMLDRADLNTPLNQFGSSGLDVSHDQL